MTLIFIMILEVTAQGSRHKEVCAWTFLPIFLHFFLFFSVSLTFFVFSFLLHIYLRFLFWPCFFTESSRVFEKKKTRSKSIFRIQLFFFGIWKLLVSSKYVFKDWCYERTAHTKISTWIESVNKRDCEGCSKSHCQQLRKNTLRLL